MSTIATKDGTQIYYKDWGTGQPVVFCHGWPLSADDWDGQMLFFGQHGYRVIAHDRRGHGRSSQTWDGNEMDTSADDLAALFEKLDLKNAIMVGHSTGGGEVARYLGRAGAKPHSIRLAASQWDAGVCGTIEVAPPSEPAVVPALAWGARLFALA
jgi:non-heme chloroperoxidase